MLASCAFAEERTFGKRSTAQRQFGPSSALASAMASWPATKTRSSHSAMRSACGFLSKRLRNERNTVDFLEGGFARGDERERGFAQRHGAGGARDFLQLPRRRPGDDQLAQLVVHHQQLADR